MSALSISVADRPEDGEALDAAFYQSLLDKANHSARAHSNWAGSTIKDFGKVRGIVFIQIVPGEEFATLDDLRAFREAQRAPHETGAAIEHGKDAA